MSRTVSRYTASGRRIPEFVEFHTNDLTSKWGFMDGEVISELFCEWELDYPANHKRALERIVREWVIPEIDQDVDVRFDIPTHNPIRALSVEGVEVEDYTFPNGGYVEITPEIVRVPTRIVLEYAREEAARS